jgi:hypothetical protein
VKRLDLLQRRINATERNFHRSLKALQTLPSPEPDPQPTDAEPTSENLALFPQSTPKPPQTPEGAASSSTSPASLTSSASSVSTGAAPPEDTSCVTSVTKE